MSSKQAVVGPRVSEDYRDTVPSIPQNVGVNVNDEVIATNTVRGQPLEDGLEADRGGKHIVLMS